MYQIKNAHISLPIQNKLLLWVLIFLVRMLGITWYIFRSDPFIFFYLFIFIFWWGGGGVPANISGWENGALHGIVCIY